MTYTWLLVPLGAGIDLLLLLCVVAWYISRDSHYEFDNSPEPPIGPPVKVKGKKGRAKRRANRINQQNGRGKSPNGNRRKPEYDENGILIGFTAVAVASTLMDSCSDSSFGE